MSKRTYSTECELLQKRVYALEDENATLRAKIEVLQAENLGMAADVITLAIAKGDADSGNP